MPSRADGEELCRAPLTSAMYLPIFDMIAAVQ